MKRSLRDPYLPWWDKQERRNFGEPVHEDNDILGVFSLEEYRHMTGKRAALMWLGFIGCVLGLSLVVRQNYPDRPSAPREFGEDGLEAELGGPHAVRVSFVFPPSHWRFPCPVDFFLLFEISQKIYLSKRQTRHRFPTYLEPTIADHAASYARYRPESQEILYEQRGILASHS